MPLEAASVSPEAAFSKDVKAALINMMDKDSSILIELKENLIR